MCHLMLPVSISSAIAPRPVALIMTGVDVLPERCRTPKHPFTLVTLVMSSRTQVLRQSTFRSIFIPANPAFKTHQNQPPRVEGIKYMFLPEKIARGRCILYGRMVTLEGIYVHKGAPCGDYFNKFISSTQSSGISEDNLSIESILSS